MLWRGVDITTFPGKQLWEWLDGLDKEMGIIQAELDRRTMEAAKGSTNPPTDRGAPPPDGRGRRVRNPFSSGNYKP